LILLYPLTQDTTTGNCFWVTLQNNLEKPFFHPLENANGKFVINIDD